MSMRCVLWVMITLPITAQADLLQWIAEQAGEEVKNTLPQDTRDSVDRLEFAGKQEYRLLKDGTDHIAAGIMGDQTDSATATRWNEEDKKFYQRRREQNVEIALEYSPEIVKDTASFFGSLQERGTRMFDYIRRGGSSEFDGGAFSTDMDPRQLGAVTRYWEEQAARDSKKEMSEKLKAIKARSGETDAERLARELGLPPPTPTVSAATDNQRQEAARLAKELGISTEPSQSKDYTAAQLQSELKEWERQEKARQGEAARQHQEFERQAAIDRAKRDEIIRENQRVRQQQEREALANDSHEEASESCSGILGCLLDGANTVVQIGAGAALMHEANKAGMPMTPMPSSASGTSSGREDESCSNAQSIVMSCSNIQGEGICNTARANAGCWGRAAAAAGSCTRVANQARDLQRQYSEQATEVCP